MAFASAFNSAIFLSFIAFAKFVSFSILCFSCTAFASVITLGLSTSPNFIESIAIPYSFDKESILYSISFSKSFKYPFFPLFFIKSISNCKPFNLSY